MPVDVARPGVGASPQVATNSSGDAAINPNDLSDSVLQVRNQRIGLVTAGDAVAVWEQRTTTSFVVHAEIRPAADGVWGSALPLSGVEGNATAGPALDLGSNGNAVVAWIEDGVDRASSGDASTGRWKPALHRFRDAVRRRRRQVDDERDDLDQKTALAPATIVDHRERAATYGQGG